MPSLALQHECGGGLSSTGAIAWNGPDEQSGAGTTKCGREGQTGNEMQHFRKMTREQEGRFRGSGIRWFQTYLSWSTGESRPTDQPLVQNKLKHGSVWLQCEHFKALKLEKWRTVSPRCFDRPDRGSGLMWLGLVSHTQLHRYIRRT